MAAFKYRQIELSSRIKRNANPQTYYKFDHTSSANCYAWYVWAKGFNNEKF